MKQNQRVRITKMLLKKSLIDLLKTKTIYKITITEICENADINRSTFYNHYNTEFDLLKEIENEYLLTIEKYYKSYNDKSKVIKILLEYVHKNLDVFRLFLEDTPGNEFFERLIKIGFETLSYDKELTEANKEYNQEYLYNFILFGVLEIVKIWISKEPRESIEEMNEIILKLLENFINLHN